MLAGAVPRHVSVLAVNTHGFGAFAGPTSAPLYDGENPSGQPDVPSEQHVVPRDSQCLLNSAKTEASAT